MGYLGGIFYKANSGTKLENTHIDSVDPNGLIWNTINPNVH